MVYASVTLLMGAGSMRMLLGCQKDYCPCWEPYLFLLGAWISWITLLGAMAVLLADVVIFVGRYDCHG